MSSQYKSPQGKLLKFFENSRNKWKQKAISAKKELKLRYNRIKFLEESKAKLKEKVAVLEDELSKYKMTKQSSYRSSESKKKRRA